MPRADFYLIDKPRFREEPLLLVCELVRKAFASEQPTVIFVRSQYQVEQLYEHLWNFSDDAFIPHQIAGDEDDPITAVLIVPPGIEVEDRPLAINLRDGCAFGNHARILEIVAADAAERDGSRRRWKEYQKRGFELNKHDM